MKIKLKIKLNTQAKKGSSTPILTRIGMYVYVYVDEYVRIYIVAL